MTSKTETPGVGPDPTELSFYEGSGLTLIPLHRWDAADTHKGRSRERGKSPIHANWTRRSYPDGTAAMAAEMRGGRNAGVRLAADWLVVDVDPRHFPEGRDVLAELCRDVGLDPDGHPRVETGGGGLHVYLRKPADLAVRDKLDAYPGVEFKTVGRQVVAAGSKHPSGGHYRALDPSLDAGDAEEAPAALLSLIERPAMPQGSRGESGGEHDPSEIAAMLDALDPEDFRDHAEWLSLMQACHHASAGDARAEFVEWCARDPEHAHDGPEVSKRWDSLHADRDGPVVTYRTLHKIMRDHGREDAIPRPTAAEDFEGEDAPEVPEAAARPMVRVGESLIVDVADATERALFAGHGDEIFQRHGELIRPVVLDERKEEGGLRRPRGATVMRPVTDAWLLRRAMGCVGYYRQGRQQPTKQEEAQGKAGKPKAVPARCPDKAIRLIQENEGAWPFHVFRGKVNAPTVDPATGRVIERPGLDPETGLLVAVDDGWPSVPQGLSREGARAAMEGAFDALFREMPFVDGPSRSAAASLLLTALLRPLLRSAPMHLVDAAAPGTGKSKLAEATALIATGGEPTTVIWSGRPEEDEKRIGSALRAADPFVLFDNVEHPLGGGQLAAALTQDPVNIRVLGQSELMTLGTRVMVAATGNNIAVAGDVGRRCVKARLDARTPEPEKRRFDWDPVKVARERRRELATQLLGAVAAYVRAGRPSDPPALGSFEAWTVVRGTLLWLGWDDPAETVADVKATDHSRAAEAEALATLNLAFDQGDGEGGPFTASDLERFMDPSDHLARPDDPLGAQLLEGKEAVAGHLLDGATSRQWMARRLKERDGLAAGEYYLEAGGRRTTSFRVYEP